jgi:hypothetical protein
LPLDQRWAALVMVVEQLCHRRSPAAGGSFGGPDDVGDQRCCVAPTQGGPKP